MDVSRRTREDFLGHSVDFPLVNKYDGDIIISSHKKGTMSCLLNVHHTRNVYKILILNKERLRVKRFTIERKLKMNNIIKNQYERLFPLNVIDYYDEPLVFTSRTSYGLFFLIKTCDITAYIDEYICTKINDDIIDLILTKKIRERNIVLNNESIIILLNDYYPINFRNFDETEYGDYLL